MLALLSMQGTPEVLRRLESPPSRSPDHRLSVRPPARPRRRLAVRPDGRQACGEAGRRRLLQTERASRAHGLEVHQDVPGAEGPGRVEEEVEVVLLQEAVGLLEHLLGGARVRMVQEDAHPGHDVQGGDVAQEAEAVEGPERDVAQVAVKLHREHHVREHEVLAAHLRDDGPREVRQLLAGLLPGLARGLCYYTVVWYSNANHSIV